MTSSSGSAADAFADRRRSPRVGLVTDQHGPLVSVDVIVVVREASSGGFSVESQLPFPVGSQHAFRFQNQSGQAATVRAVCRHCMRINRSDTSSYIAGFEFVAQPAENLRLIIETVSSLA
jgi:hypothetical protein